MYTHISSSIILGTLTLLIPAPNPHSIVKHADYKTPLSDANDVHAGFAFQTASEKPNLFTLCSSAVFGFSIKQWVNVVWVYLNNCKEESPTAKSPTALLPPPRPFSYHRRVQPSLSKVFFFSCFHFRWFCEVFRLNLDESNFTIN